MAQKQKLLTYNPKKNPLVEEFFQSIEDGMQSHKMREAIEFYMAYKDKTLSSLDKNEIFYNVSESASGNVARDESDSDYSSRDQDNDNYEDFNPDDL